MIPDWYLQNMAEILNGIAPLFIAATIIAIPILLGFMVEKITKNPSLGSYVIFGGFTGLALVFFLYVIPVIMMGP